MELVVRCPDLREGVAAHPDSNAFSLWDQAFERRILVEMIGL